jgi:carboxyl-terminal processing protease
MFAGLLAGCASLTEAPVAELEAFSEQASEKVFAAGYGSITEKYIEPVAIDSIALDGMRGLASLDPALTVEQREDGIALVRSEEVQARFPIPAGGGANAWAALTIDVLAAGRKVSSELSAAPAEKIYEAVFDGALTGLDVFSRYAGAAEARRNRTKRDGFGGIGIRFVIQKGAVRVTRVIESTPAEAVGLEVGDRIVSIDGKPVEGIKSSGVIDALRGPTDSQVSLSVARSGFADPITFDIVRAHIVSATIYAHIQDGIAVFRITSFNQGTARGLRTKIRELLQEGPEKPKGLVLDMRGNPGGLLKQSVRVADIFITEGKISSTRGRHPESIQYFDAGNHDLTHGLPMVVLIDGKSASAAEIVAAALQDSGRAVIVGTSSFGKGTVQTVIRLPNDGEITLTWSRLLTPAGNILHGLGVRPGVCTSGLSAGQGDLRSVLLADRIKTIAALSRWRQSPHDKPEARRELRISCPAERRGDKTELDVARMILEDPALYAGVLGLAAGAANDNYQKAENRGP